MMAAGTVKNELALRLLAPEWDGDLGLFADSFKSWFLGAYWLICRIISSFVLKVGTVHKSDAHVSRCQKPGNAHQCL